LAQAILAQAASVAQGVEPLAFPEPAAHKITFYPPKTPQVLYSFT